MFVLIEDNKCETFADLGVLSERLHLSRNTVVNWFRSSDYRDCKEYSVYKVTYHFGSNRGKSVPCDAFKKNIIRNDYSK